MPAAAYAQRPHEIVNSSNRLIYVSMWDIRITNTLCRTRGAVGSPCLEASDSALPLSRWPRLGSLAASDDTGSLKRVYQIVCCPFFLRSRVRCRNLCPSDYRFGRRNSYILVLCG